MKLIRYKRIEHERTEDAPFVGALVCANDCHIGCEGCFNQHLRSCKTLLKPANSIISEIKANPFNEGIILAGLEWSEQPDELVEMIEKSLDANLKVIVYTGLSLEEFLKRVPKIKQIQGSFLIKYGGYESEKACIDNINHRVHLASSNQCIVEMKDGKVA